MPLSIAYIELFPIVLAASLWGHPWFAKRVDFCFDNKAMVEVLRSHTSRDSNLMVLLRHLSLLAPRHSFVFASRHIPGKSNAMADAISRFAFRRVPSAGALCVSHSNTSNPFGPSPAACNLDQKCQLYLSNGLATSTRRVYRWKTGKKTILKSWSNRPFPAKQSHGTKTPCWNANSAVRPWNESSTSNAFVFPTSLRKLIRPFPLRFTVLSLSTSPYTFVIISRLVTKLRMFIIMYYLSSDFEH